MHWACASGNVQVLQTLMAAGGRLDAVDNDGCLPWFEAMWEDTVHCGMLKWLATRSDIDWCHRNNDGFTALQAVEFAVGEIISNKKCRAILARQIAMQKLLQTARWSPARAAFLAAVTAFQCFSLEFA